MKRVRFPKRIKRGSCVVTIYRTRTKGYPLFTVAHYGADGNRCRQSFADYSCARKTAVVVASKLSEGKSDMLVLTGQELLVYRRALQALKPSGAGLDTAAMRYTELMQGNNGHSVATIFRPIHELPDAAEPKLVTEVLRELLAAKEAKGRSHLYLTDLRVRLTRFADAMPRPISDVTTSDIDGFLQSLDVSARSQNNFRATIGTLFKFGQTRGYVSRDHPCVSHVEKASQEASEIHVFTPDEMASLLKHARTEIVPVLVLGAFAGVRSEEIKRLSWDDIKLKQGHIEIKGAKSKTQIRRLVAIPKNLMGWLLPYVGQSGPVTPFANLAIQFAKLAGKAKVKWVRNGLRHSFISYRVAQTRNVAMVALEAGNSPGVINRNYLKHVTAAEARKWFSIMPAKDENLSALGVVTPDGH
jgi:integrase